jgi:DTW domain-containing protein
MPAVSSASAAPHRAPREVCLRCRRPRRACWCPHLAPVESATRACFLQHPRERHVAIGTARMAHLSLPNSELHLGVSFEDHPRVRALAAEPGTALLFPGEGALDPASLRGAARPRAVIVVDGTWAQARKVVRRNPFLQALPRLAFTPARPSSYRIRAEPSAECVSTIEAVVHLLGALEGAPERFQPILRAFDRMIDLQIAERDARTGPPRWRRLRARQPRIDVTVAALRERPAEVVALYAEANAWPIGSPLREVAELIQLVAVRPSTGERFEALLAPRRPLGPQVATHLELPAARLLAGEPVASGLARFRDFVRPTDLFCGWGPYAHGLLAAEGGPVRDFADLRLACARVLGRRPGGVEQAVRLLGRGELPAPLGEGRAGRRLASLGAVLELLAAR